MRIMTLLLALIVTTSAWGQQIKLPEEVKIQPGRLAGVKIEWDGDDVRWTASAALDVFREYDPDQKVVRLRLIGYAPGRYELKAIAAKGGKLSDFATCTIIVGDPGPVPPIPPPGPPPVPPDSFVKALEDAYRQEDAATRSQLKEKLAALYRQGAVIVPMDQLKTWGQLFQVMKMAADSIGISGKLTRVQVVIQAHLQSKLPVNPNDALDRPLAIATFKSVADALDKVKE